MHGSFIKRKHAARALVVQVWISDIINEDLTDSFSQRTFWLVKSHSWTELMRAYIWCYRASGMMPSSMFFTAPVLFLLWHVKMSAVRAVLGIRLSVFHKEWFHWITLHLITLQECGSCKQELALLDCWGKKNTNRLMTLYTSFCCQWQIGRLDVIEKVGFQSDIK